VDKVVKESEKSAKRNRRACEEPNGEPLLGHARAVEKQAETDSRDSFWNSYPVESLTPEQRKHFKEVMRKEVRNRGSTKI